MSRQHLESGVRNVRIKKVEKRKGEKEYILKFVECCLETTPCGPNGANGGEGRAQHPGSRVHSFGKEVVTANASFYLCFFP